MSKNLLTNKALLIVLAIIAIGGLLFIVSGANQTKQTPPSQVPPTTEPQSAKMMPPVTDHPVSGQIIVKFNPQYSEAQINAHLQQYHASVIKTITGINQTVVKVPVGQEETISQQLQHDPYVETVQRDYTTHAFFTPNDPLFNFQYAYNNTGQAVLGKSGKAKADIRAEAAWNTTKGNGIKVAILDTGINLNQPDLTGKIVLQKSFVSNTVEDGNGHGTHVAGIIAADSNNGIGVAGTCPECQLLIGKVLDDNGEGTTSNAADGITWAAQNGAKVISMSLGTTDSASVSLYQQAITYATQHGAIVVAAAGNDGTTQLNYPAGVNGVVSVAATTNTDAKASYSNYGNWVQIAAPGDNILSTGPTHSFQIEPFGYNISTPYYYLSGTSMATPVVSGVAALIASTSFGTTPQTIISRLYSTADKIAGTGTYWVNGRVDAAAAVGQPIATPTLVASVPSLITPTLFCVGGNGTPPCATLPPSTPSQGVSTVPPVSGDGSGGLSPSAAPSNSEISPVNGNPEVSGSPSVSPPISGTPGTILPCPSQNQGLSLAVGSEKNAIYSRGGREQRNWGKMRPRRSGFISGFIQFLLQLLLRLLQLIGLNPCSGSGTPGISPIPQQPSNTPSQGVSTVPPASGIPSQGDSQPTSAPTSAPAPTTPVTSSSCTNPVWSSSNAQGTWNAPDGYEIQNDAWNGDHGPQTIYACSGSNFYAVSNQTNNGGEVKTYPDTGKIFNDSKTVGSFTTITSTFGEAIQQQGEWDAAYDIWTNNWGNELMIWNDTHNHPEIPPSNSQAVTIDGVPYHVWRNGSDYTAFMRDTKVQSGSVNILDVFKWLESQGWMKTSDKLTAIEYGVEVSVSESAPGVQGQQKFPITNFSVTTN